MAIKTKDGYKCSYCGKLYPRDTWADSCRDGHDLVYVQLSRADLLGLLQFLVTKEEALITPNLFRRLRRYAKLRTATNEDEILSTVQKDDSPRR